MNVSQLMESFDDNSKLAVFNDACPGGGTWSGYEEHKGLAEIRAYMDEFFTQLGNISNLVNAGPNNGDGVVTDLEPPNGNVFVTWATTGVTPNIEKATDTSLFKVVDGNYKIAKQTIIKTVPDAPCVEPAQPPPENDTTDLHRAFMNHISAFAPQNETQIVMEYIDTSVVQTYETESKTYTVYTGIEQIQGMFKTLWGEIGERVTTPKLLQIDDSTNTVFLAWTNTLYTGTDTFQFDENQKIVRQNIVRTKLSTSNSGSDSFQV